MSKFYSTALPTARQTLSYSLIHGRGLQWINPRTGEAVRTIGRQAIVYQVSIAAANQ